MRYLLFLAVVLGTIVGCSSEVDEATTDPQASVVRPAAPERPDLEPLVMGARSAEGLQAILGTSDLAAGANRVGFVLTSPDGFVTAPTVKVSPRFRKPGDSEWQPLDPAIARFNPWPYGSRGMYTAALRFPSAGTATLDIAVQTEDGGSQLAILEVEVKETPFTPAVGEAAVKSESKTFDSTGGFGELTTGSLNDPDLYRSTIADAVSGGLPTLVVFASPAFCTNAVCGPQIEVLQELKDRYLGRANFIHVDFYDNPEEIQGDLTKAVISPTVREWNLPSIEWTFVIDADGVVTARFEAFATVEEVEEELLRVL